MRSFVVGIPPAVTVGPAKQGLFAVGMGGKVSTIVWTEGGRLARWEGREIDRLVVQTGGWRLDRVRRVQDSRVSSSQIEAKLNPIWGIN